MRRGFAAAPSGLDADTRYPIIDVI